MNLDPKILPGKKPLSYFDAEQGNEFIGKECYFSNIACKYKDLDDIENSNSYVSCTKGTLSHVDISDKEDLVFADGDVGGFFKYCLPCEWVKEEKKEPKYRPYTLKEFIGDVNLGGPWIRMRPVGTKKECKFLYTGYLETAAGEYICLGCFQFDLISLFKNYEICVNGEWQPFGIEEQV